MDAGINKIKEWKEDPILFFTEVLGENPDYIWSKMQEVAYSVRDNRKTIVKAGHGVSKSYTAARIVLWYLYTHYPSTVFTTAPTHNQVENILWREIKQAKNKARFKLPGKLTVTGLDLGKDMAAGQEEGKWFAIGFATKPDQGQENATKLQGLHNENFLAVFDEGCGIIKPIWEAKEGLLTSESCRFLAIGNPTQSTGDFVDCFSDSTYNKITISVLDTPNYKQKKEVVPGLSGRDFVDSIRQKYGEESNQWKSRVIGEIPESNANSLLTSSWVDGAIESKLHTDPDEERRYVTWDVADGGKDLHVIKSWIDMREVDCKELHSKTIEQAEPHVWRALRKIKGNTIVYDADGVGRVAGKYLELSADKDTEILGFVGSSREVSDNEMFKNKRAEGHWKMRNMFKDGEISISNISDQREELLALRLAENNKGLIQMEKKDIIKKEIGRSPNYSDAIMMACSEYEDIEPVSKRRTRYWEDEIQEERHSFMGV